MSDESSSEDMFDLLDEIQRDLKRKRDKRQTTVRIILPRYMIVKPESKQGSSSLKGKKVFEHGSGSEECGLSDEDRLNMF